MPVNTDPTQAAADWAAGLANKTSKIQRGIQAVQQAPGAAAARQQSLYTSQVAANAGKWARNVSKVSLSEWQQAAIEKGLPRIATGAAAAQSKMAGFYQRFLPAVSSAVSALPPRGTFEQNKARMNAFSDAMHKFGQTGG